MSIQICSSSRYRSQASSNERRVRNQSHPQTLEPSPNMYHPSRSRCSVNRCYGPESKKCNRTLAFASLPLTLKPTLTKIESWNRSGKVQCERLVHSYSIQTTSKTKQNNWLLRTSNSLKRSISTSQWRQLTSDADSPSWRNPWKEKKKTMRLSKYWEYYVRSINDGTLHANLSSAQLTMKGILLILGERNEHCDSSMLKPDFRLHNLLHLRQDHTQRLPWPSTSKFR